jgi:polysaccharide export outer membrane protein
MNSLEIITLPQHTVSGLIQSIALKTLLVAVVSLAVHAQVAQTTANLSTSVATNTAADRPKDMTGAADYQYRIGRGDTLEIRIYGRPDFSRDGVRVDERGNIRMPLIKDEIQAACRTELELAQAVATAYLDYLKHPNVDVFVKEFNSQPVAVMGAVGTPGRFQLHRPIRLLELMTYVGGPSVRAGRSLSIIHAAQNANTACSGAAPAADTDSQSGMLALQLTDVLKGDERANPLISPGDLVSVPEADQAYIIGNVLHPMQINLNNPVTLTRAIAMAGGLAPDAKQKQIRVLRQTLGSTTQTETLVDLTAITKREAQDILLQANDIIDIPAPTGVMHTVKDIVTRTMIPNLGMLPLRIIP